MAQPLHEQPQRSPVRSSALKMTPHTPSPNKNPTALSSPSITITTLASDSGYESDARSGSMSIKEEFPFHRRRTSSSAFSRKSSSSIKRPRSRASGYADGDILFDPMSRQVSEQSMEDPLDVLKDPTPPQLFVSFSDPIPERPSLPLRERTVSSPASSSSLGFALSGFNTSPKPPAPQSFSLHPAVAPAPSGPKPTAAHLGRSPLHKQPYRRPSEDPAWSLDEPVKLVTEDHMKALYQSPNYNIEELNEDVPSNAAPTPDWPSDSDLSPSDEPGPSEKPRQQHYRSNSSPAVLPPPIKVPPNSNRLTNSANLPPKPELPPGLERFLSTPAVPVHGAEEPVAEANVPQFEEERPWAGLNDLFLEATRVMTRLHARSESSDSAFLAPPMPKTNPSTPPVTPVTAVPALAANQDDDSELNEDLASTLYDSALIVETTSSNKVKRNSQALAPMSNDSAKWGFMFFGLVGGMVIGNMLSRGRM